MVETRELGDADVHIWAVDPQTVDDPRILQTYESILSAEERERRARLRLERMRHDYLVAHALLRESLSLYADVAAESWTFRANRHGRPELSGPPDAPPLRFNLSHTDGLVVCAVTRERDVGVDVEDRFRPLRHVEVARRFFAPAEVEVLTALPDEERRSAFFTLWTLKESYMKAVGLGMALPLRSFCFRFDPNGTPSIRLADRTSDARRWRFSVFRPTERHVVALAVAQTADVPTQARLHLTVPTVPRV